MTAIKVEWLKTNDLIPYANNTRIHTTEQIAQIATSIQVFGFNNPILIDEHNGIIAGHGRYQAASQLKLEQVPIIRLIHLTDAQRKAFMLADNRIALNADWDRSFLSLELSNLKELDFDLELLGFNTDEITSLLNDEIPDVDFKSVDEKIADDVKLVTCPACHHQFPA